MKNLGKIDLREEIILSNNEMKGISGSGIIVHNCDPHGSCGGTCVVDLPSRGINTRSDSEMRLGICTRAYLDLCNCVVP
ncbi:MAG: hypothetical protein RR312_09575 [Bacteroidales bacterium]